MALTVASIAADVSVDIRQVLIPTDTKIIGWIDRIHKDCLHSSVYSYLNIAQTSFSTFVGTQQYGLTPSNIRRILGVYDSSRDRILFPIERASSPVSQVEKQEPGPGQQGAPQTKQGDMPLSALSLQSAQPEYFRHVGPQIMALYPTPQQVINILVSYEQQVVTLVNPTDVLVVPEDARDIVVAGVDFLANAFLKRNEEAQAWQGIYKELKTGVTLS
jgi:hypothetical protein